MIAKTLSSFKDNLIQKSTNPFLGTLVLVWIFHNWELVFTLFNFPSSWSYDKKVAYIGKHLEPMTFATNLIHCITVATAVLFITYFLLNMSRLIVNFYEKIISPKIYKVTDKSSIVLKSDYDLLLKDRGVLEKKLEEERGRRMQVQSELDNLEKKYSPKIEREKVKNAAEEYLENLERNYGKDEVKITLDRLINGTQITNNNAIIDSLTETEYLRATAGDNNGTFYEFSESGIELKLEYLLKYRK